MAAGATHAGSGPYVFPANYMDKYRLYTKEDVFNAYEQLKVVNPTAASDTDAHLALMRPTTGLAAYARFDCAAFEGYKQFSYIADHATNKALLDKFDKIFPDIGEFLKLTAAYDISDMLQIHNMSQRILLQKGKWANAGSACDDTCLANSGTDAQYVAIKTIETLTDQTKVQEWIMVETLRQYDEQKAFMGQTVATTSVNEAAYNFCGYTTGIWQLVDWNFTKVQGFVTNARATTNTILYKDTIDTSKLKVLKADGSGFEAHSFLDIIDSTNGR